MAACPPIPGLRPSASRLLVSDVSLPAPRAGGPVSQAPQTFEDETENIDEEQAKSNRTLIHLPKGQVNQLTVEVDQDRSDSRVFRVQGKDKSWFIQKGAVTFERSNPQHFVLEASFVGGKRNRFGDHYAELSRADQLDTINWMIMMGVARSSWEMSGYKDCKASGFYFLVQANYRRTAWNVIGCPHNCEVTDMNGDTYASEPQGLGHFEFPAYDGQRIGIEYTNREVWLLSDGKRIVRGCWAHDVGGAENGLLPDVEYAPALLLPNCPTEISAEVQTVER